MTPETRWHKTHPGVYVTEDGSYMVARDVPGGTNGVQGREIAGPVEWSVVRLSGPSERDAALAGDHLVGETLDYRDTMREAKAMAEADARRQAQREVARA